MLAPNVADLLKKAQSDSTLAEQVRNAGSYESLAELSEQAGTPATAEELRSAFTARNAGVLAQQMMRRGLMEAAPLPPVQAMDHELWNRVAGMDLSAVVKQLVDYLGWTAERAAAV